MEPTVFIDHGYDEKIFRQKFISSPDFNKLVLLEILNKKSSSKRKDELIELTLEKLNGSQLSPDDVMKAFLQKSRGWLAVKVGTYGKIIHLDSPSLLLDEFGESKWYGPYSINEHLYYLRILEVKHHTHIGMGEARTTSESSLRWCVSAQVTPTFIALHWDGFGYGSSDNRIRHIQFPFWNYIPTFFDELSLSLNGQWQFPNVQKLVLQDLWDKYLDQTINQTSYIWKHLRIRAEASGVALNARSAGSDEIDINGLQALSIELAKSVLQTIETKDEHENAELFKKFEKAIVKTLIHEWGTKSYEFYLDKIDEMLEENQKQCKLFKSHAYFGAKPGSNTQDRFSHFRCFSDYGGSRRALDFLLTELGIS